MGPGRRRGAVPTLDGFRRDRDRVLAAELSRSCEPYHDVRGEAPASLDEMGEG